jgi:hypothetical protein
MTEDSDKPKIIIDEDWKSQVEREKDAAQEKAEQSVAAAEKDDEAFQMPEASFPLLVTMLASQAMMALGQMPHPVTGKAEVSKPEAKHFIDLLAMLEEKTKGNLTGEEGAMLSNIMHQLRMAFVAAPDGAQEAATPEAPAE